MSKYAVVFPATRNCVEEAKCLVNSMAQSNPNIPLYITTSHLEDRRVTIDDFIHIPGQNIVKIIVEPPCDSEFRQIRTARFRIAAELKDEYSVVGLLDADMVIIRDISAVMRMAEAGTLLVTSNNTLLCYRHKDFVRMQIKSPGEDTKVVMPTFCTVPMFVNPSIHEEFLMNIWNKDTNPSGNDLETINLLVIAMGLLDSVYHLTTYSWNNIHHSQLKFETHVKMTDDGLYSQQGENVYALHGHWLDEAYVKELINPMIKNYGHIPKAVDTARNAINDICKVFRSYSC